MTKEWKSDIELEKSFGKNSLELTKDDMMSVPPAASINQFKNYCPICKNAETYIRYTKHISKIISKEYTRLVYQIFVSEPDKYFSIKEIISKLGAENLSNGDLQRKALTMLVAKGYLTKTISLKKVFNKKGELIREVEKHLFIFNKNQVLPECYDKEKDCHINNWSQGIKFLKKEEDNGHN